MGSDTLHLMIDMGRQTVQQPLQIVMHMIDMDSLISRRIARVHMDVYMDASAAAVFASASVASASRGWTKTGR